MRLGPHETAAGSEPIGVGDTWLQPDHESPVHELIHNALSVPRPKTSRRFRAHAAAAGPEVNKPPSDAQVGDAGGSDRPTRAVRSLSNVWAVPLLVSSQRTRCQVSRRG